MKGFDKAQGVLQTKQGTRGSYNELEGGLTIREYFSAMFMQGLLSSWGQHDVTDFNDLASDSVKAADALIEKLNK